MEIIEKVDENGLSILYTKNEDFGIAIFPKDGKSADIGTFMFVLVKMMELKSHLNK